MELDFLKIKEMSTDEQYNTLLPLIKEVYNRHLYLNLDDKELAKLIKPFLGNLLKNVPLDNANSYLLANIDKCFNSYLKKQIVVDGSAIELINSFINMNLFVQDSYINNVRQIYRLTSFLKRIDEFVSPYVYKEICEKNDTLKSILKIIVYNNYIYNEIERLDDEYLEELINVYCQINHIKIDNNDIIKDLVNDNNLGKLNSISMYLRELPEPLTLEEENLLAVKLANGDLAAKQKFIEHNLRLVISFAKRKICNDVDFLDIVQEGNLGLMRAVEHFDVTKGYRFSTYASWWIKRNIKMLILEKSKNIHIPCHTAEKVFKLNYIMDELEEKYNRKATVDELALAINLPTEKVVFLQGVQLDTVSLNNTLKDEGTTELIDMIASDEKSPEMIIEDKSLPENIMRLFNNCKLKKREREVLILRYGLNGSKQCTLIEIGKQLNISKQRVSQIERRVLLKIKASPYIYNFVDYMDNPQKISEELKRKEQETEKIKEIKKEKRISEKQTKPIDALPKRKKTSKKILTIYEYFNDYSREEIDEVILNLSDYEKKILYCRYGRNLNSPSLSLEWNKDISARFYHSVVPKMRRNLLKNKKEKSKKLKLIN